ncbi:NAD(P)/FAD-dependent oxidoreductase [Vibrio algivorus]|uniref:Dehydrogenase n=1 Tax=Vibrio algivorus TaxID=1667024 RepID=A0ABQ6EPS6_9VIBR|nr:NAD(P)/FAD-dependent oxidoreductase [Vibrio algivorus]GLT15133.1 dehydrogenase [Vibrio algivorus]
MSIRQKVPVVIIGAGPSGSVAAAILKQHDIDCIVLERSTFPRFSIGESLLPACMESLKKANLFDAVNKAGFQFKNGAAFRYQGKYTYFDFTDKYTPGEGTTFQVQRGPFDKLLADEAQKQGVEIRYQHTVTAVDIEPKQPVLSVIDEVGKPYQIQAGFILDASGYGRVLPRLLDLELPSDLSQRKALFTHVTDNITDSLASELNYDRDKITIYVHPDNQTVWYWLIPFSNGVCSVGVVSTPDFFEAYPDDEITALKQLTSEEPHLKQLFKDADFCHMSGTIGGYSANVKHLAGSNYAMLGNAGEFLDPVFSSGVTIAMKSAELATDTLIRQFNGEAVDWQKDYSEPLMVGVDTFRAYVEGWYDGRFQNVVFFENAHPEIKKKISSILAGYAWDISNPYVANPQKRLSTLAEICSS